MLIFACAPPPYKLATPLTYIFIFTKYWLQIFIVQLFHVISSFLRRPKMFERTKYIFIKNDVAQVFFTHMKVMGHFKQNWEGIWGCSLTMWLDSLSKSFELYRQWSQVYLEKKKWKCQRQNFFKAIKMHPIFPTAKTCL